MVALIAGLVVVASSGIPGLFMARTTTSGQKTATALMGLGCALGVFASVASLFFDSPPSFRAPWIVPGGEIHLELDGISAVFLIPIFVVALMGSLYGLSYWKQTEHTDDGRKLSCFYGLLTAGLSLVVVAKNTILFLAGWEIMAASAFLVLTTEDRVKEVADAGFIYLCSTRISTLCLFAFFALLWSLTGGFEFSAPPASAPRGLLDATFLLGLVGFGLKAGIMPLHLWLPGAHASAPSHVSAVMSGVLLKTGIYGLVRTCSLFPSPPLWWGELLLLLGAISGVLGVAFAIGQHDLKRLLAYHSVENIGIIMIGLGLATMGRSLGRADLAVLGLAGALLHVINHGLFKALLFLSAGSVVHATKTREIDHLGGLLKTMPRAGIAFMIGAVAICGLPPLNGFVSELLIYLGLLRSFVALAGGGRAFLAVALGAPALAMIGALAVACFVKVFGAVFLGAPRSERAHGAHDADSKMTAAMVVLASCCALIGVLPMAVAPLLVRAAIAFAPEAESTAVTLAQIAPLSILSLTGGLLLLSILLSWRWLARRIVHAPVGSAGTWDCGYAAPSASMQYTSSSFAEMLVRLFAFALRPKIHRPSIAGLFPGRERFHSHVPEPVLDSIVLPLSTLGARMLSWLRWMQAGSIHMYLVYVLIAVLALLFLR